MNAFMRQLSRDVDHTFLNLKEFGEVHTVNGVKMPVVIDTHQLQEMKTKSQYASTIANASLLIHVKAETFGKRPAHKALLDFDGKTYRVVMISGELMYKLALEVAQ